MAEKKLLAIVTTIYNDYYCLPRLIESLLRQDSNNFTHYIYDDGSKEIDYVLIDDYISRAKKRTKPYDVFFIKMEKNTGVNKMHEIAFKNVQEKYFTWVDSDDFVDYSFVRTIEKEIDKKPMVDIFHINSKIFSVVGGNIAFRNELTSAKNEIKELKKADQITNYCCGGSSVFYHNFVVKKDALVDINSGMDILPFDQAGWYDWQITFCMALFGKRFHFISKPVSFICSRPNSVSSNYSNDDLLFFKKTILADTTFKFPSDRVSLYSKLCDFSSFRNKIINLLSSKNIINAKKLFNEEISFAKTINTKKYKDYVIDYYEIRRLFIKQKYLNVYNYLARCHRVIL